MRAGGAQKLRKRREAVNRNAGCFTRIFDRARDQLVEDVLRAFGIEGRREPTLTGKAAPSVQRLRAVQLARIDETIKRTGKAVYKAIEQSCSAIYREAVREAVVQLELDASPEQRLADSRLHLPTIELQRKVLETEATKALITTRRLGVRVINSYYASSEVRAGVQEAIAAAQLRGGGMKAAADEVFKVFNASKTWQGRDIANAVAGKFIEMGGRHYDLARYAELMAQSRFSELYNRAQVNEYVEDGYVLVQIDDHNTTAEVCQPFEGTIWSITGEQIGPYRPLSQCLNGGPPFHPRCSHYVDPIEIDAVYTRLGKPVVRTSGALYNIKGYAPNAAVLAAEERIKSRLGKAPSLMSKIGWVTPSAAAQGTWDTSDDAGAPGKAGDVLPDSGIDTGKMITPTRAKKLWPKR